MGLITSGNFEDVIIINKHDNGYYRYQEKRNIERKLNILKRQEYDFSYFSEEEFKTFKGKLKKGKIHCSCKMCNWHKVTKELKISDIRKLQKYYNVKKSNFKKSKYKNPKFHDFN